VSAKLCGVERGRHLYSTGRPSRWALAHILVGHRFTAESDSERILEIDQHLLKLQQNMWLFSLTYSVYQVGVVDAFMLTTCALQEIAVSRPASCIAFTDHVVIFATDKFYSISFSGFTVAGRHINCCSFTVCVFALVFLSFWLLVGHQKEHPACKKLGDELQAELFVWSEVQMICIWYSRAAATATPSCLASLKSGLPRLSSREKRPLNGCLVFFGYCESGYQYRCS